VETFLTENDILPDICLVGLKTSTKYLRVIGLWEETAIRYLRKRNSNAIP